jgi:NCAIR mutase (PurE)-related protein
MDATTLLSLLRNVRDGERSPEEALSELEGVALGTLEWADVLGGGDAAPPFARIDHDRAARCGYPEVIYGPGKTPAQVVAVAHALLERSARLLVTRTDEEQRAALAEALPDLSIHARAGLAWVVRDPRPPVGSVVVLSAGTADEPVAEEARVTAEVLGADVNVHYDSGVAGLHRLLPALPRLRTADVVVVVAGMDGALAAVVGGLVDAPVIAVPTSVGYGASFAGVGPLLTMLSGCAAGVAVVNIDNGFGAGYLAATIARRAAPGSASPSPATP